MDRKIDVWKALQTLEPITFEEVQITRQHRLNTFTQIYQVFRKIIP